MYECVSHKLRGVIWRRLGTPWDVLSLCLAGDALRQTYSVSCRGRLESDLFRVLQGTTWDRLILYRAEDPLSQIYSVSCKGRLESDLFCVLQGTTWDRFILFCRGRRETDWFCVLQGTTWDRHILCLAGDDLRQTYSVLQGIGHLPAKANSSELITALRRHLGSGGMYSRVNVNTSWKCGIRLTLRPLHPG
jgi:hypothetical protein